MKSSTILATFTLSPQHPDYDAWLAFMSNARSFLHALETQVPAGKNRDEAVMRVAKAVGVAHGAFVAREKGRA